MKIIVFFCFFIFFNEFLLYIQEKRGSGHCRGHMWKSNNGSASHDQIGHSLSGRLGSQNSCDSRKKYSTRIRRNCKCVKKCNVRLADIHSERLACLVVTGVEVVDKRFVFVRDIQHYLSSRTCRWVEKIISTLCIRTTLFAGKYEFF